MSDGGVMTIDAWGHSCFLVRFTSDEDNHVVCLFDPVPESKGRPDPALRADFVLISHPHENHSAIPEAGAAVTIRGVSDDGLQWRRSRLQLKGIEIKGIATYHDQVLGADRGKNMAFVVRWGEFKLAHLGDLGHKLTSEQCSQLAGLDVLMIPCQGPTISPELASDITSQLAPKIVIPMHYDEDSALDVFRQRWSEHRISGRQTITDDQIADQTQLWTFAVEDSANNDQLFDR